MLFRAYDSVYPNESDIIQLIRAVIFWENSDGVDFHFLLIGIWIY